MYVYTYVADCVFCINHDFLLPSPLPAWKDVSSHPLFLMAFKLSP